MAFDRLAADDPAALDLLTMMAWCGPEPVPLALLTDHPDVLPTRCSRSRPTPGTGAGHRDDAPKGNGHALPARPAAAPDTGGAVARPSPGDRDGGAPAGWAATRGGELLDRAAPASLRTDPDAWLVWRRLLPHVLVATGTMMRRSTRLRPRRSGCSTAPRPICSSGASPRPPLAPYERAYDVRREEFGDDHPDTLTSEVSDGLCKT